MQTSLPFYSLAQYYQKLFKGRVRKLALNIGDTCPNRLGLKGMKTCIFCDEWGSSAHPDQQKMPLIDQIHQRLKIDGDNYHTKMFLAYFQAYTSTFLGIGTLSKAYDVALEFSQIKGLIAGTRPDCVSKATLNLWNEVAKRTFMSVEFGVQSFHEHHLDFLRRGHSVDQARDSICKVKENPHIHVGVHLIFGLPGETIEEVVETAKIVSSLPIDSVKLHNLHVLRNTPLQDLYDEKMFTPLSLDKYSDRAIAFLRHLDSRIAIERLAAMSNRWNELIAPEWTRYKMLSYQYIIDKMNRLEAHQGDLISSYGLKNQA